MSRISLLGASTLLIIAMTVLAIAEKSKVKQKKTWPDFSCHQKKKNKGNPMGEGSSYAALFWNDCLQEEIEMGSCPKICILGKVGGVRGWDYDSNGTQLDQTGFYINSFVSYFHQEMIYVDRQDESESRDKKVEQEMGKCKNKFPDIKLLNVSSSCGPWKKVLDCIDKAWSCATIP